MADRRARAVRLIDHVRVIQAKKGPTVYLPHLLMRHTVVQCTTVFAALLSYLRRCKSWSKSRTAWKNRSGIWESCLYSSFVFSCSKTPVTATSYSHWCRKHGDLSQYWSRCLVTDNWGSDNREPMPIVCIALLWLVMSLLYCHFDKTIKTNRWWSC